MFQNYFTIAWRNLRKHKAASFINIFGLAVGLTCCLLITVYIYHESSYDQHLPSRERLFQLGTTFINDGKEEKMLRSAAPLGQMLQAEYPEVETTARTLQLFRDDKTLFQAGDGGTRTAFYEEKGLIADSAFFTLIPYDFKEGNPSTSLGGSNNAVISEVIAEKLFGGAPALDKIVRISSNTHGDTTYRITGVFRRPVHPSHIEANFFLSFRGGVMDGFANDSPSVANNNMFNTYVRLRTKESAVSLQSKFPAFIQRHLAEEMKQTGRSRAYFLTPVADIHLSGMANGLEAGGSKTALSILGFIALLTLLIACINFMNLATASSARRATEVGIRKVLGAERRSLLLRFLAESVLMALLAMLVAALLALMLLPLFERVSGKTILLTTLQKLVLAAVFVGLALVTGLLAGSYPALYLSAFRPIRVLKGRFASSFSAVALRKGLVVFQFVVSIVLIIASVVIADQMQFLRLKDLGFVKDQQIIVPIRSQTAQANLTALRAEAKRSSAIQSVGAGRYYPGTVHPQDWLMYAEGQSMDLSQTIFINTVDDHFLQTLGVKPLAGRLFSPAFPGDSADRFVINEEAAKRFGFASPQAAIGKYLAADWDGQQNRFVIVGVVKNFHFKDLHEEIKPLAFRTHPEADFSYLIASAGGSGVKNALSDLEKAWKSLNPNEPFDYSFLDQDFQQAYESEERQASLINYFTIVAIIISCLGLFGLATFTAEQRTKEIGIRKVLGASVAGVVALLSKDFLKLVGLAAIIASPLAWWGMNKWLQNFAYKTSIGWWVFVLTMGVAMLIAFATISIQAIRAAVANPVKSLRTE